MESEAAGDPHTAMLLLLCVVFDPEENRAINDAVREAIVAAQQTVGDDLLTAPAPQLRARERELRRLSKALAREGPLAKGRIALADVGVLDHAEGQEHQSAWRMVLAYMSPEQQQLLQAAFVQLRDALEDVLAESDSSRIERLVVLLDPAQRMLAELPHTSLPPPGLGPDIYDQQRRSLTVEVIRDSVELPDDSSRSIVCVEWLDGMRVCVAHLECFIVGSQGASWILEIKEPSPGRTVHLALADTAGILELSMQAEDAEAAQDLRTGARLRKQADRLLNEAMERDLQHAIDWGFEQLGKDFSRI